MTPTDTDHANAMLTAASSHLSVTSVSSVILPPIPNAPIAVRLGTRDDIPFIDALQKRYSKALGFFPRAQLEGYIDNAWTLIAEMNGLPVGFVASRDRYLKRDELGVIYQLCVSPESQRGLIAASLIKAVFERSAYGCKLYCCWCAQDLAANGFWEALGFVPIAFRGGSAKKSRVHIFWQKRIRAGDQSTPWWFPAKTEGGAIREDRIVLPIPLGVHWSEAMPRVSLESGVRSQEKKSRALPALRASSSSSLPTPDSRLPTRSQRSCGIWFAPAVAEKPVAVKTQREKKPTVRAPAAKADPALIAAARELRDRYLEQVNELPSPAIAGKYDVTRQIAGVPGEKAKSTRLDLVEPISATVSVKMLAA